MTRREAEKRFRDSILPEIVKHERGQFDKSLRRQAFNDWTDGLYKDGEITKRQYDRWEISPALLKKR